MISRPCLACRVCGDRSLRTVCDFGALRLSAFPVVGTPLTSLPAAPLHLVQCAACDTVQLADTVDPALLYGGEYWYASGVNELMRAELNDVVRGAITHHAVPLYEPKILDIGANDGTLLEAWRRHLGPVKPVLIGVEPSALAALADQHATAVIRATYPTSQVIPWGPFDVITAIAMFYDLDDPVWFLASCEAHLSKRGLLILQFQDLAEQVRIGAWDNCCHEHLGYYTLGTIEYLAAKTGLQVIDVERRRINGGSLRVYLQRRGGPFGRQDYALLQQRLAEQQVLTPGWQARMVAQVHHIVRQTQDFFDGMRLADGSVPTVDMLGASTKANTFLQVCQLGPGEIRQAWERQPRKVGRMTVTGIPIVDETQDPEQWPHLLIGTVWQFKASLLERQAGFLETGRGIWFPLPEGHLYLHQERA